jgi:hypothetical protein
MMLDRDAGEAQQLLGEADVAVASLQGQGEERRPGKGLGLRGQDAARGEARFASGLAAVEDHAASAFPRELAGRGQADDAGAGHDHIGRLGRHRLPGCCRGRGAAR